MEEEYDLAEKIYLSKGIVTRNDVVSIDSRAFGRTLEEEMSRRGYPEAVYREFALKNYVDYSGVLFNSEEYTAESAEKYMKKFVLTDKRNF